MGQGLEGDLTDLLIHRILDNVSIYYKDKKFDEGTLYVVDSIIKTLEKESINHSTGAQHKQYIETIDIPRTIGLILVILILFFIITGFFGIDSFIVLRMLLDLIFIIISLGGGGKGGGWSGGGGKSSGGGSSGNF